MAALEEKHRFLVAKRGALEMQINTPGTKYPFIIGITELDYKVSLKKPNNQTCSGPDLPANQSTDMKNETFHHGMGSKLSIKKTEFVEN